MLLNDLFLSYPEMTQWRFQQVLSKYSFKQIEKSLFSEDNSCLLSSLSHNEWLQKKKKKSIRKKARKLMGCTGTNSGLFLFYRFIFIVQLIYLFILTLLDRIYYKSYHIYKENKGLKKHFEVLVGRKLNMNQQHALAA